MFDPNYPPTGADIESAPLRNQFNSLKGLIDAIMQITSAQVDATNTLPPGNPASVSVTVTGNTLHFTFSIPQGEIGPQGPEGQTGPPGEVTFATMSSAIETALQLTSNNSNGVGQLGMVADGSYQQWQLQAVSDKLDELINALRRSGGGP